MISDLHISIASANDAPELVSLINAAYRGEGSKGWTSEAALFDGARTDAATLTELFSDKDAVILKYINDSGAISGCVYLKKQRTQIYLGLLSVSPDIQAAGIGKRLLAAASTFCCASSPPSPLTNCALNS